MSALSPPGIDNAHPLTVLAADKLFPPNEPVSVSPPVDRQGARTTSSRHYLRITSHLAHYSTGGVGREPATISATIAVPKNAPAKNTAATKNTSVIESAPTIHECGDSLLYGQPDRRHTDTYSWRMRWRCRVAGHPA